MKMKMKMNWLYDYFDQINVIAIPQRLVNCKKVFKEMNVVLYLLQSYLEGGSRYR